MMKTTMMIQFLLLGSLFGQTSAIFPCRTHCQDVCENFVEGSRCYILGVFNPSECGNNFPQCRGLGSFSEGGSCRNSKTDEACSARPAPHRCTWCRPGNSCYCNMWGCACKPCGDCSRPSGADDEDEDSTAEYMMFLQMTTKEKMDTLDRLYCAPLGLTAEDYGFVAEMEELMAHGDGDISKKDYDEAYFSESEVDPIVHKYCVDPSSSAIAGMSDMSDVTAKSVKEELKLMEMDSKSAKEKNKRMRNHEK